MGYRTRFFRSRTRLPATESGLVEGRVRASSPARSRTGGGGSSAKAINEQLKLVELADRLGFNEAWFGEHHINDFSVCPSPSILLANAIARTKNIRLGAAGYLAPFYDAVRLAEEVAMLDNLSGGRINLGFAKGAFAPDSKHFKTNPSDMRKMMFETIDAVHLLLNDNKASFSGEFVNFENADIEPKFIQYDMPTYVATFSSPQTIEFAAKRGFGLMGSQGLSIDDCKNMSRLYEIVLGVKPKMVLMRTFAVANSDEEALHLAQPSIDHFIKSMKSASSFNKSPTFDKQKYASLVKERETFFDGEKFLNCGIIGSAFTCIEQIKQILSELGDNVTIALKPVGTDYETNSKMLRIFNEQIRPFC